MPVFANISSRTLRRRRRNGLGDSRVIPLEMRLRLKAAFGISLYGAKAGSVAHFSNVFALNNHYLR